MEDNFYISRWRKDQECKKVTVNCALLLFAVIDIVCIGTFLVFLAENGVFN